MLRVRPNSGKPIRTFTKQGKVFKTGLTVSKMKKEETILSLGLSYTPSFVKRTSKFICMSYLHDARDFKGTRGMYPRLREMGRRFHKDTGFHHGDLNPMNIMYAEKKQRWYLVDFEKIYKSDVPCGRRTCRCYPNSKTK